MASKMITLVTGNENKLQEIVKIMGNSLPFKLVSQDLDLPEYQGEERYIIESKCKAALDTINGPVIVEDTSLCFNAMGGLPGPYIKWFLKELGPNGLYRMLSGWTDKSAKAVCSVAYSDGRDIHVFRGVVDGNIVDPRGPTDFGWDPCFQPLGYTQTYAQMDKTLKNQISHRFLAFNYLKQYLLNQYASDN
ncbi:inosine triphosphate pyrophosphatase-like [Oppia nitens]|uniref:inosine triphosphate pyrophosphatase-like n=1 Tax=Oppia nitens TaxID=1686743 RepID=UPI0023DAF345|nr:inosine triphosphate pyrophosphatase-like [Oppia nitens]